MRKHSSEVHEGKKPLKCDICDHCFSQNGSLKIQMLPVHDENKTFKCELVITALLTRAVRLNTIHIASVHNAKKSFKCDICDPSFYKKKHIVKVHESKKPFTCNLLI